MLNVVVCLKYDGLDRVYSDVHIFDKTFSKILKITFFRIILLSPSSG